MALEYLCSSKIECGKQIVLPRFANRYRINSENLIIEFYRDNPGKDMKLSFWKAPRRGVKMDFEIADDGIGNNIVIPRFYDSDGKLLKIGNR